MYQSSQESILDSYSDTYATGLDFSYTVTRDVATLTWKWDVVGDPSKLLLLSYIHHRTRLQSPEYVDIEYLVLLGKMQGVKGNVWRLNYDLPTINFHAEHPVHTSCMAELNRTLEVEVNNLQTRIPAGFYFWGGSFARDSRLALIAEQLGREDLIQKVVRVLKDSIQPWYEISFGRPAAYETNWGGLIDRIGWNSTADTGSGFYTDHHFMLGYIIHGAAVIGRFDPDWLKDHADFIDHVCRDIGNPSPNDQYHTVARHMDFFQGHSWASGVANDGGGRGQEASGEAINAYYSMVLWGHTTQNQNLVDWARLLLAIEIQGSMLYYHLYPKAGMDETPYPEQELRDYVSVGNLHDKEVGAWLYWGSGRRYQLVGIQILPLTPIVKVFCDIPWMEEVIEYCAEELENPEYGDSLKSVIYAAYANVDPKRAHNLADWGSGNSHSNTLYLIATNPSQNEICSNAWIQPEGQFLIQDVASGKYVTTSGSAGNLLASTTNESSAAVFSIQFAPGGSYIQLVSNGKWVSATPSGSRLTANKDLTRSYELFRWAVVSSSAGTYTLQATVNKVLVATAAEDGGLYNNAGVNGAVAGVYKLISKGNMRQ